MFPKKRGKKRGKKLLEPRRPLRRFKKKFRYHYRQCLMFPIFSNRNILFKRKIWFGPEFFKFLDPEFKNLDSRHGQLVKSKRKLFLTAYGSKCTPEVGIDTGKSLNARHRSNTRHLIESSEISYFFEKLTAKIVPSTAIVFDR
jgi:hypothetical protein